MGHSVVINCFFPHLFLHFLPECSWKDVSRVKEADSNNVMGLSPSWKEERKRKLDQGEEDWHSSWELFSPQRLRGFPGASACEHLDAETQEVASGCAPGTRGGPGGTPLLPWTLSAIGEVALSPLWLGGLAEASKKWVR